MTGSCCYHRSAITLQVYQTLLTRHAQVVFIAAGALATAQNAVGGYRHTYYLTEQEIVTALEINYMLRAVVIVAYIPSKAAVGGLILRLTHRQSMWQRPVVWVVIIVTALLNALNTIFNFVQCTPVEANWNPAAKKDAQCWPAAAQLDFAYFQCGTYQLCTCICPGTDRSSGEHRRGCDSRDHTRHFPGQAQDAAVEEGLFVYTHGPGSHGHCLWCCEDF